MKKRFLILPILCCYGLSGCSKPYETITVDNNKIYDVNTTSFNPKDGGSVGVIDFETQGDNYCNITIRRDNFVEKQNELKSKNKDNPDLALMCRWDNMYFTQSKKLKTSASVSLHNYHLDNHMGTLEISLNLVNAQNKKYLKIDKLTYNISEDSIMKLIN